MKKTGDFFYLYVVLSLRMLQQVTAEVQPRLAAQINIAVSLDRTRICMMHITFVTSFALDILVRMTKQSTHPL